MEVDTESYRKWYDRKTLLSSVGVDLPYSCEYKEGEVVTADFKGITLRFVYTEASIDRCFFALLKAEDLKKYRLEELFAMTPKLIAEEWATGNNKIDHRYDHLPGIAEQRKLNTGKYL